VQVFLNTFGIVEAVLMDLGCLPHGLLISKWRFISSRLYFAQGSVNETMLFNIIIKNLLFENSYNFSDDNTLYVCGSDISDIISQVE